MQQPTSHMGEKTSSEVCFQFFVLHVVTNEYRPLWEARLCCEHKIKDIMLQPFYSWASVFWEHENIMRVLTAASLSAMGHMCAAVCQGLPSLLQKLPLFWSLNILLGSSLSYTQMKAHRCAVHTFLSMHCKARAQTLRCSLALLSSDVLQEESRESVSPHIVPTGTAEAEFCFSSESL